MGLAGTIDSSQSTGSSTISLPITFNPGAGTTTVNNSGATLLLSGVVTATSGLSKQGQGTLSLEANDGLLGATVDAGTLLVDGTAGDISVNTGGTLGGMGNVAEISTTSGTVSPGDSATSTGILTDTGNLVLSGSSTFAAELNGTTAGSGYDQLVAGGTGGNININGTTLNVTLGSAFPTGGGLQYTILHNTATSPIVGTFSGLAQGATLTVSGQSFSISYTGGTDGRDVVLTSLLSTTTTLSPVSGTHVTGQTVALTATVTPASGTGTPTGSIEFENGTTNLGSVPLTSGNATATLDTTQLTAGTNTITAVYSGDSTFATSTSQTIAVVVTQASTTTTLTSNLNPSVAGEPVTLTATVSPVSPGSGSPTGTVIFSNGSTHDRHRDPVRRGRHPHHDDPALRHRLDHGGVLGRYQLHRQHVDGAEPGRHDRDRDRHGLGLEYQSVRAPVDHAHVDRRGSDRAGHPHGYRHLLHQHRDQPGYRDPQLRSDLDHDRRRRPPDRRSNRSRPCTPAIRTSRA